MTPAQQASRHAAAIKAAATRRANKAAGIPPNAGRARASAQSSTAYSAPPPPGARPAYAPPPPPPPPPPPYGARPAYSAPASAPTGQRAPLWGNTPAKDYRTLAYEGLAKFEEAMLAKFHAEKDATRKAAIDAAYKQYTKIKATAIHPNTPIHEADNALGTGACKAIKAIL